MTLKLVYSMVRSHLSWAWLSRQDAVAKNIEILMLRHLLAVAQRRAFVIEHSTRPVHLLGVTLRVPIIGLWQDFREAAARLACLAAAGEGGSHGGSSTFTKILPEPTFRQGQVGVRVALDAEQRMLSLLEPAVQPRR
jgi:hypothetical protein